MRMEKPGERGAGNNGPLSDDELNLAGAILPNAGTGDPGASPGAEPENSQAALKSEDGVFGNSSPSQEKSDTVKLDPAGLMQKDPFAIDSKSDAAAGARPPVGNGFERTTGMPSDPSDLARRVGKVLHGAPESATPPDDAWMDIIERHPELSYHQAEIIRQIGEMTPERFASTLAQCRYLLDRMERLGPGAL